MDVQSPLLAPDVNESSSGSWVSGWIPCRRQGPHVPTNAETVQRLIAMRDTLAMTRERAREDYEEKAVEVAALVKRGYKHQAYESMRTAKQYRQEWETRHAMHEAVERIKSRLIAQQHNMALFSSFAEANQSLAKMLEDVPLDKVEKVLDEINERMAETHEVSNALATPAAQSADMVEDDELTAFLAQAAPPSPAVVSPVQTRPATAASVPASRLMME